MNNNYYLDIAYIAGLFDGEGCVTYKKYKEKKRNGVYNCWRINMEIAMTDQNVIELVHETLMVGTVRPKKVPKGYKKQKDLGVKLIFVDLDTKEVLDVMPTKRKFKKKGIVL